MAKQDCGMCLSVKHALQGHVVVAMRAVGSAGKGTVVAGDCSTTVLPSESK